MRLLDFEPLVSTASRLVTSVGQASDHLFNAPRVLVLDTEKRGPEGSQFIRGLNTHAHILRAIQDDVEPRKKDNRKLFEHETTELSLGDRWPGYAPRLVVAEVRERLQELLTADAKRKPSQRLKGIVIDQLFLPRWDDMLALAEMIREHDSNIAIVIKHPKYQPTGLQRYREQLESDDTPNPDDEYVYLVTPREMAWAAQHRVSFVPGNDTPQALNETLSALRLPPIKTAESVAALPIVNPTLTRQWTEIVTPQKPDLMIFDDNPERLAKDAEAFKNRGYPVTAVLVTEQDYENRQAAKALGIDHAVDSKEGVRNLLKLHQPKLLLTNDQFPPGLTEIQEGRDITDLVKTWFPGITCMLQSDRYANPQEMPKDVAVYRSEGFMPMPRGAYDKMDHYFTRAIAVKERF